MPLRTLLAVALCGVLALAAIGGFVWLVASTLRHRRAVVAWVDGRAAKTAVLPLLIALGTTFVVSALAPGASPDARWWMQSLLTAGTVFGSAAAVLLHTVFVHETGICRAGTLVVAWSDVTDYVDRNHGHYVFFSSTDGAARRRTDIHVPRRHRLRFDAVVSACVEARIAYGIRRNAPRRTPSW